MYANAAPCVAGQVHTLVCEEGPSAVGPTLENALGGSGVHLDFDRDGAGADRVAPNPQPMLVDLEADVVHPVSQVQGTALGHFDLPHDP